MEIKEIYKMLRCFEHVNYENPLEELGGDTCEIKETEFMVWLRKKNYINDEKLELFKKSNDYKSIYSCLCGAITLCPNYAVFPFAEVYNDNAKFKSLLFLAEYIYENKKEDYFIRFALEAEDWSEIDNEKDRLEYKKTFQDFLDDYNIDEEYDMISNLSIDEINNNRIFSDNIE